MLKENWRSIARIERLFDNLFIVAAFFIAYYFRVSLVYWSNIFPMLGSLEPTELAPLRDYFMLLVSALILYNVVLSWFAAYGSMRLRSNLQIFWLGLLSSAVVFVFLAAILFTLKVPVSRSFVAIFCGLVTLMLTLERFAVLRVLRYWRRKGRNFRNVIICGIGEQSLRLAQEIGTRLELGIGIRAFADLSEERSQADRAQFLFQLERTRGVRTSRIITGAEAVKRALTDDAIDEVIFTDFVEVMPQVQELILVCSEQGVRTTIAADLFGVGMVKSGISYFGDMPLIHFQTPPGDGWPLHAKRLLDILVSLFVLVIFLPMFIVIGIVVKLDSPGPIFFKQKRVGLNGRIFSMYKFRSMVQDAEQRLTDLANQNEMRGPVFKMSRDPRVTRVGRILRRLSLDELPQFLNVLRGDMSLVGPRPPVPGEVSLYERRDRRRLSMRPGLTCTWQVSGRNEIADFESWVKMDLAYIDSWSLARDFILLFKTIPAVVRGRGAR